MNNQIPIEEDQDGQISDRPTLKVDRTPKHAFTFNPSQPEIPQEKPQDIPKEKPKEKPKRKLPKLEDTDAVELAIDVPPKIVKEKKKKAKGKVKGKGKGKKSGSDTPKFGDKKIDLAATIDITSDKSDILGSDDVILNLPQNEKYHEDIMIGLNVISYLQNRHVPRGNKAFYILLIAIFIASCVINLRDLVVYARTTCSDNHSGIAMYFNFIMIIFAKFGVFNYITSEMNANLDYDLKFPFIIPILSIGVLANLQLPLILYDYHHCSSRSTLLQLNFGYFVVNIAAILVAVGFIAAIVSLLFFQKIRIRAEALKMAKTIAYFIGISLMVLLNALFLFVSLSQTNHFSLTLLGENITYWVLVVSGVTIFIIRKKYNIMVFTPLPESDFEQKSVDFSPKPSKLSRFAKASKHHKSSKVAVVSIYPGSPVENPLIEGSGDSSVEGSNNIEVANMVRRSTSHNKKTMEKALEKIDEENETDSPTTMHGLSKKELQEDLSISNFVLKHVKVPMGPDGQNNNEEKGV